MNYHFVPQFYLRNIAQHQKLTGAYHIGSKLIIEAAPIKGQCYRVNSHDVATEARLCAIEGSQAALVKSVIAGSYQAGLSEDQRKGIVEFVSLMLARNAYRVETFKKNFSLMMQANDYEGDLFKQLKKTYEEHDFVKHTLSMETSITKSICDMGILFLESDSSHKFITSDNPVVIYNPLFEDIGYMSYRGIESSGVVFYVPLSAKLALFLYDKSVYEIKGVNGRGIKVGDRDICSLNALEAINASECLYFSNGMGRSSKRISEEVDFLRQQHNVVYTESALVENELHHLIHMYEEFPNAKLNLSFLKIPNKVKSRRDFIKRSRSDEHNNQTTNQRSENVKRFNIIKTVKVRI